MTSRGRWLIGVLAPFAIVAPLAASASCASLEGYSTLRNHADGAPPQLDGAGGPTDSNRSGSGGRAAASGGNAGAAGSPSDSGSGGSLGGTGGEASKDGGFTDAVRDSGDAAVPIDGDARRGQPSIDIVDGATLQPVPSTSSCGWHFGSPIGSHVPFIVDFGCPDVLNDFTFVDVDPFVAGVWQYEAAGDPHLVELANAQSFPMHGLQAVLSGSKALYMPKTIHDGLISVRSWSSDDDGACLVIRYQDVLNFYRLCLSYDQTGLPNASLAFRRITNADLVTFGFTTIVNIGRSAPGHVIGLEAVGHTFTVFLDGARLATYQDPDGYTFGRVGIEDMLLKDAHFDDFTVITY